MLTDYIGGIAGGIAVVLVGHPFDTTKTRLQAAPSGYYSNTMDCVKKTFQNQGFKGFYSGIGSPLAGQMLFRATSFGTFFCSVKYLSEGSHAPSASDLFKAGALTGFVVSFIEAPIDLVKTKMQTEIFKSTTNASNTSFIKCAANVVRTHGTRALWQGWSATAIRNTPANAAFFPVNELVKRRLAELNGVDVTDLNPWQRMLAGAAAGLSYWVGTYPLDAIKGRMQAASYSQQTSYLSTVRSMYQQYGWKAFFRGVVPCAARAVPACAAMFTTVDYVRMHLNAAGVNDLTLSLPSTDPKVLLNYTQNPAALQSTLDWVVTTSVHHTLCENKGEEHAEEFYAAYQRMRYDNII